MTREELEGIEEELGHVRECYKEVIRRWMKETEPKPTWQVLVTALREIREERVARYIKSTYTVGGSHTQQQQQQQQRNKRNTHYYMHTQLQISKWMWGGRWKLLTD